MRLASGSDWLGKLTLPLNWAGGPTSTLHCVLLTQGTFFAKEGVRLGRAVLEAPEPFCEVLDPLIGAGHEAKLNKTTQRYAHLSHDTLLDATNSVNRTLAGMFVSMVSAGPAGQVQLAQ